MTERRYTVIFGVALLTAGLATLAVYRAVASAGFNRPVETRAVVVATADVPAGLPIEAQTLTVVNWPASAAPANGFAVTDSLVGRVTREALVSGSPVLAGALAPKGAAAGYEGAITPGHRAVSIRVNEAAGVSGLVRRDSRVDVLVTVRDDQGAAPVAWVVAGDVRVLGVGAGRAGTPGTQGSLDALPTSTSITSVVTLEVTPADAAKLVAAETRGTIQLVLRGYGSRDTTLADYPAAATGVAARVQNAMPSVASSRVAAADPSIDVQRLATSGSGVVRADARPAGALPGAGRVGPRTGVGRTAESVRLGRGGVLPPASRAAAAAPASNAPAPVVVSAAPATAPAPSGRAVEGPGAAARQTPAVRVYRGGRGDGAAGRTAASTNAPNVPHLPSAPNAPNASSAVPQP